MTTIKAGPYSIGSTLWPGLSKLIEECGEVSQVVGKLLGTGGESAHWDGSDLRLRLQEELGDLLAAIDFVMLRNGLDFSAIQARRSRKYELFNLWHNEQGADVAIGPAPVQETDGDDGDDCLAMSVAPKCTCIIGSHGTRIMAATCPAHGQQPKKCEECNGQGQVYVTAYGGMGGMMTCTACLGTRTQLAKET